MWRQLRNDNKKFEERCAEIDVTFDEKYFVRNERIIRIELKENIELFENIDRLSNECHSSASNWLAPNVIINSLKSCKLWNDSDPMIKWSWCSRQMPMRWVAEVEMARNEPSDDTNTHVHRHTSTSIYTWVNKSLMKFSKRFTDFSNEFDSKV